MNVTARLPHAHSSASFESARACCRTPRARPATSTASRACRRPCSYAPTGASKAATLGRPMIRSSALTYQRSAPRRPSVGWVVLDRRERLARLLPLALLVAWFVYTRLYFFLHPRGLTFDPSLF